MYGPSLLARYLLAIESARAPESSLTSKGHIMKLTRIVFLALAVLLPTSWTIAQAADAPPADAPAKKTKKSKKSKKAAEGDKKADDSAK